MTRYVIKNYLKLMCRSAVNVLLFIVFPIIMIALLSSAFSALMKSYECKENFTVGYTMNAESDFSYGMKALSEVCKEQGITLQEFSGSDPKKVVEEHGELSAFVDFGKDSYSIYQREDEASEAKVLEYILSAYSRNMTTMKLSGMTGTELAEAAPTILYPEHQPAIDSTDYYGIIEIAYFLWCAIICASGIISSEKKYHIIERLRMAGLSESRIYFSKLSSSTLVVSVASLLATIGSILLFGVKWGNPILSALIVFLMVIAALSMEFMFLSITDNLVLTIAISFAVVWFMGFFGGSFESYLFASHPYICKVLSPIYHGNRALVELSMTGKSDYVISSLLYSAAIAVVCSALAVAFSKLRKRGRA